MDDIYHKRDDVVADVIWLLMGMKIKDETLCGSIDGLIHDLKELRNDLLQPIRRGDLVVMNKEKFEVR